LNLESFEEKLKGLLETYAEKVTEVEREYWQKLDEIDRKEQEDLLSWEDAAMERDRLEDEWEQKLIEVEDELWDEIESLAEKMGLELVGPRFEGIDETTYASGMGWRHARCIYSVCSVKLPRNRVREYKAEFIESHVYGDYQFKFKEIWSEESPLITPEATPFTYRVTELVPWQFIRDIWERGVIERINQLAEAEIEGRLEEGIRKVKASLKPSLWVYDFQHLYNAIEKAIEDFNL